MKTNPQARWRRRIKTLRAHLITAPFWLLGGVRRVAAHQAGRFEIRRLDLAFPQLPEAWDGLTITQISDLHIGPGFTVESHLPPVIDACLALKSDLILITGDWVDRYWQHLPPALPQLRRLQAPLGVYGCLGNHDIFRFRWPLIKTLRELLGPNLLINRSVTFERDGQKLALLGLDFGPKENQIRRHLAAFAHSIPADAGFRIVMAHDPAKFPRLCKLGADLVLSGHTHGGQISLLPEPYPVIGPAMFKFRYMRGLYREGNAALHVNRGLSQMIPIRFNNPPEITRLRLTRLPGAVPPTLTKS